MQEDNNLRINEQQADVGEHTNDVSQVISDDIMVYLHIYLNTVARTIISVVGVVTNIINMVVFSQLGLKDSISVGLFSLSLTDLLVTSIQIASCICYIIGFLRPDISTEILYLDFYVIGWVYSTVYEISCWVTALVSLERCFCVVSPFKVKQVFTRHRSIIIILTIYVLHIGIHAPVYANNRVKLVDILISPGNNSPIETPERVITMNVNEEVKLLELILDLTAGVSMWLFAQAVVIACAVCMGYSLEASSKVRHNVSNGSLCSTRSHLSVYSKNTSTLSNRERRLVKVVLILAITLTCCNVPKMIGLAMYHILSDEKSHKYDNLDTVVWALTSTCGSLGCSLSFVVYLNLNINYRHTLLNLLFLRWFGVKGQHLHKPTPSL